MADKDKFEIDYKLLPPKLQMKLWVLALDANTSRVNIAYRSGSFFTGTAYSYGGNVEASLSYRRFSTLVTSSGDVDLGLVFRGYKFGTSASVSRKYVGFSVSYGAGLLPFPSELSSSFNSAAIGLQSMTKDISSAPNNPLVWFKSHSDDAAAIGNAISLGQQIAEHKEDSSRFGASLRLNFSQQTGLIILLGLGTRF